MIARMTVDLAKIEKALAKIQAGSFGTDDEGKEISEARLRAMPWADKAIVNDRNMTDTFLSAEPTTNKKSERNPRGSFLFLCALFLFVAALDQAAKFFVHREFYNFSLPLACRCRCGRCI